MWLVKRGPLERIVETDDIIEYLRRFLEGYEGLSLRILRRPGRTAIFACRSGAKGCGPCAYAELLREGKEK